MATGWCIAQVAEPLVVAPSFQAPEETGFLGCFDVNVKWDEIWKMCLFFDEVMLKNI